MGRPRLSRGRLQQGIDPEEAALRLGFAGYQGSWCDPAPVDVLAEGDSGPRADAYRPECEMVLEFVDEVWNHRRLNRVTDFMVRDLVLQTVADTTVIRPDGYQRDLLDRWPRSRTPTLAVRDVQTNFAERYAGAHCRAVADEGRLSWRPTFGPLPTSPSISWASPSSSSRTGASCARSGSTTRSGYAAQINNTRGDGLVDGNANIY